MKNLLEIQDLTVRFHTEDGTVNAVNHVDLRLEDGMTLGVVGETGAGKTTLAKSIMRIIPHPPGKIEGGKIIYGDRDLLEMDDTEIRSVRGKEISMIFQDPMSALNPVIPVGEQIAEVISIHENLDKKQAYERACAMLEMVGIPAFRAHEYPHQFSGGMKQRVVIAIALACSPRILIADEPTTALDVTIQAQVLEMMRDLKEKFGTSILMITHDLGVVAQMCQKVAIMYAGEIVESGTVYDIFDRTAHPYTEGLLGAIPKVHLQERRLRPIDGLMPDPMELPAGCAFCERCKYAQERCSAEHPPMVLLEGEHYVRCFRAEQGREEDKA